MAELAEVEQLIIGHFSARYKDPEVLGHEARAIFPATIVAREGLRLMIGS
jgi:ribonuclease Z